MEVKAKVRIRKGGGSEKDVNVQINLDHSQNILEFKKHMMKRTEVNAKNHERYLISVKLFENK